MTKRRLLWIGDAGVNTGFARCTHEILKALTEAFDVHVLALGYNGDMATPLPWPVYRANAAQDGIGIGRVPEMLGKIGPAAVVVQNDPWNIPHYLTRVGNVPLIGILAVDGLNCRGAAMNGLQHAIFWTKFGEQQAKLGGYTGDSSVVPLGVDMEVYHPMPQEELRARMKLPQTLASRGLPPETFIVGVVGRNQQRKRLDLTIEYFSEWVHAYDVKDAVLWIQQAPTGEQAYDLEQLGRYYKINDRLIMPQPVMDQQGVPDEVMVRVYNVFDAMMTTTQGEGWGLPQMEGMACGIPQVVPQWAALDEWATAALQVPCLTTAVTPHGPNVLGGIPDRREFCAALDRLYRSKELRAQHVDAGMRLVRQPQYRWPAIGQATLRSIEQALYAQPVITQQQEQPA